MTKTPEAKRFVDNLKAYYENSRGMARKSEAGTTPAASANKTIQTRETLYGDKKTSGAGIQSISKAGKARTNSTK